MNQTHPVPMSDSQHSSPALPDLTPTSGAADPNRRSILIVEDDALVAEIYRSKFERAGYLVEVASDGQRGFYRMMEWHPNVLLLDLSLPTLQGLDVLKKVRAQKTFERTQVFVLTNHFMSDTALEASQAGASAVFDKATATPDRLVTAANRALQSGARPPAAMGAASVGFQVAIKDRLVAMRGVLSKISTGTSGVDPVETLTSLGTLVDTLTSHAAAEDFEDVAWFASALGALIEGLRLDPASINPSTLATMDDGIGLLGELSMRDSSGQKGYWQRSSILVVDDDDVPRKNIIRALTAVNLNAVSTGSPVLAQQLLAENSFDLIFLDVEMPGMNGFQLCEWLRQQPQHARTPVIFVTGFSGLDARSRSILSGGDEFIAKPFLPIELAVKALRHALQGRRT